MMQIIHFYKVFENIHMLSHKKNDHLYLNRRHAVYHILLGGHWVSKEIIITDKIFVSIQYTKDLK